MKTLLKSTFGLVIAVMAFFAVVAVVAVKSTSTLMVAEATKTVRSVAKNTTGQIDRLMTGVETAVANQKWIIGERLGDPDYMYRITRELVANNPCIVGSTVAFTPGYYPEKGHFTPPTPAWTSTARSRAFSWELPRTTTLRKGGTLSR